MCVLAGGKWRVVLNKKKTKPSDVSLEEYVLGGGVRQLMLTHIFFFFFALMIFFLNCFCLSGGEGRGRIMGGCSSQSKEEGESFFFSPCPLFKNSPGGFPLVGCVCGGKVSKNSPRGYPK